MLPILINNEYSRLRSVLFGTSQSNGPIPLAEDCYDPSSLLHVESGTYPVEVDMRTEMAAVLEVFEKYEIPSLIQKLIEDYTTSSFNLLEKMSISESNKEKLISFGAFLMGRNK